MPRACQWPKRYTTCLNQTGTAQDCIRTCSGSFFPAFKRGVNRNERPIGRVTGAACADKGSGLHYRLRQRGRGSTVPNDFRWFQERREHDWIRIFGHEAAATST